MSLRLYAEADFETAADALPPGLERRLACGSEYRKKMVAAEGHEVNLSELLNSFHPPRHKARLGRANGPTQAK